ncbi:MAG TPA: twin-arginine translocase TatA/TatE family subunit [Pyrinomonadaceae bacterium]|nr:twin-arginine translocase TatA/TatE family subunit [Pyrinomonadaceae bacterium]
MYLMLFGLGGLGTQELLIILAIVFVLFGASRLPQLAKALGQSKRAFREGQEEADEEERIAARKRERLRAAETEDAYDEDKAADKVPVNKAR